MAPLQVLSVRLSVLTRSLPLPTLRQLPVHVCRRLLSLEVSSSSSRPVIDCHYSVSLLAHSSSRRLSRGKDDLQLGALASGRDDIQRGALTRGKDDLELGALANGKDDLQVSALASGKNDLQQNALERSGSGVWRPDAATFDDLGNGNGLDSSADGLDSDGSEGTGHRELPTDGAQFWSSDYAKFVHKDVPTKEVQAPNYLTMSDKELFVKCRMDTYRASGPGGQHRNKTESAVRLTHMPTGLVAQAADDRSQHINRSLALTRLRQVIALEVREPVELEGYKPTPDLIRILPSGSGGKRGNSQKIGPNHPDFVLGMKALMDLLWATGGSVSHAGTALGLSTGALSKLITSNNLLWQGVNKLRASKGLRPLR